MYFLIRKTAVRMRKLKACIEAQAGQAMTEYLFLVVMVALVVIPLLALFPEAVQGYVRPFFYCVSRPIP